MLVLQAEAQPTAAPGQQLLWISKAAWLVIHGFWRFLRPSTANTTSSSIPRSTDITEKAVAAVMVSILVISVPKCVSVTLNCSQGSLMFKLLCTNWQVLLWPYNQVLQLCSKEEVWGFDIADLRPATDYLEIVGNHLQSCYFATCSSAWCCHSPQFTGCI